MALFLYEIIIEKYFSKKGIWIYFHFFISNNYRPTNIDNKFWCKNAPFLNKETRHECISCVKIYVSLGPDFSSNFFGVHFTDVTDVALSRLCMYEKIEVF